MAKRKKVGMEYPGVHASDRVIAQMRIEAHQEVPNQKLLHNVKHVQPAHVRAHRIMRRASRGGVRE